jgi:SagB-type dehydrogenase family enzyme
MDTFGGGVPGAYRMEISAKEYHRRTGYERHKLTGHYLDWGTQPSVFKTYPGLKTVPLPAVTHWVAENLSRVIDAVPDTASGKPLDLNALSRVLLLAQTITAKAKYGGADFFFRSVASAGALYPFELYVAALDVAGLDPGLYHWTVSSGALTLLRPGKAAMEAAVCVRRRGASLPAVGFFVTAIYFRTAWKYRDRAYRYHLLDSGHLVENLALALKALRIPFDLSYDFDDAQVNELLGVDEMREVCLAAAAAGPESTRSAADFSALPGSSINLSDASRVALREVDYPEIRDVHRVSCSISHSPEVSVTMTDGLGLRCGPGRKIVTPKETPESLSYPDVAFKRRSMRNFVEEWLPADRFSALLRMICAAQTPDKRRRAVAQTTVALGFVAAKVAGVDQGFYLLDRDSETFALVSRGNFAEDIAHCCLSQIWLQHSALHFLFLTNLDLLERTWGPRGYRYALLEAGRLGQRLYLAATAMKLGCCGIGAFYDSEAGRLFGLNDDSALLYLVAIGPVRKIPGGA